MPLFAISTAVILVLTVTTPAVAQVGASDLERLRKALLTEVRLTTDAGQKTTGVLQTADKEVFTLLTRDGNIAAPANTVRKVERRGDSLKNGFIIGALAGIAFGATMTAIFEQEGDNPAANFAVGALMTGLIGTGIDALHHGWTTVYRRPEGSQ